MNTLVSRLGGFNVLRLSFFAFALGLGVALVELLLLNLNLLVDLANGS